MEQNGELIFLYQLIDGLTDNSHAVYTAMLAGVSQDILDRVTQVICYLSTATISSAEIQGKHGGTCSPWAPVCQILNTPLLSFDNLGSKSLP